MVDWLVDWLVGRSVDWLVGWLVDWLVDMPNIFKQPDTLMSSFELWGCVE